MPVIVSMLRAVNVGGRNKIKMEDLKALYVSLKLRDVQTFIQSGNVVFRTDDKDLVKLAERIEKAIEKRFGFRPPVILRTAEEMRGVVARNPFAKRKDLDPRRLLVVFLAAEPDREGSKKVSALQTKPEELRISGREVFIYFPDGMGRTKLPWTTIDKMLKTVGTARNCNSVNKLLSLSEKLE